MAAAVDLTYTGSVVAGDNYETMSWFSSFYFSSAMFFYYRQRFVSCNEKAALLIPPEKQNEQYTLQYLIAHYGIENAFAHRNRRRPICMERPSGGQNQSLEICFPQDAYFARLEDATLLAVIPKLPAENAERLMAAVFKRLAKANPENEGKAPFRAVPHARYWQNWHSS